MIPPPESATPVPLPATLDRVAIGALIPHAHRMCLLDRVVHWDEAGIDCLSDSHRDPDNPLRGAAGLRALHAFEYAAQAAAVHGALTGRRQRGGDTTGGGPAFLAGLRDARLHLARLDQLDAPLCVRAELLLAGDAGTVYGVGVRAGGLAVASGRLTVIPRRPE